MSKTTREFAIALTGVSNLFIAATGCNDTMGSATKVPCRDKTSRGMDNSISHNLLGLFPFLKGRKP